jgi:hypothetical protein
MNRNNPFCRIILTTGEVICVIPKMSKNIKHLQFSAIAIKARSVNPLHVCVDIEESLRHSFETAMIPSSVID